MTRSELRWCLRYGALLAALSAVPYAVALASQGEKWEFTGSVFAVEDGNSYIAKMRLGASGQWLFRTPYSAQPQAGIPAFLPYLLLGKLAGRAPSHWILVALYHALRVLSVPLATAATYRFLAEWVESARWRRWGTVLGTLGGGLGWALLLIVPRGTPAPAPLEFYSPEAFGFLALYGIPHLALARAALLLGICWELQAARQGAWGWRAGFAWLSLALLQPLAMASAGAAFVAQGIGLIRPPTGQVANKRWRGWLKAGAGALLLPAPLIVYLAIAYARDPILQSWAGQNLLPSPPLWYYLLSYLPLLPLVVLGARQVRTRSQGVLAIAWPVLLLLMAYAPLGVQRRLVEGIWVGLLVLAAVGLERISGSQPLTIWLGRAVLLLCLPTTLLLLAGGMQVASHPEEPAFRSSAEVAAFDWLAEKVPLGSVVLASFQSGNALPAWAPVRVVIGHGPESAGLDQLLPEVQAVFAEGTSDSFRQAILEQQGVDFVFHGPHERALGSWNPAHASFLLTEYEISGYAIFRVR